MSRTMFNYSVRGEGISMSNRHLDGESLGNGPP
jgi:hypothetical protein